jgi:hypothetical protein
MVAARCGSNPAAPDSDWSCTCLIAGVMVLNFAFRGLIMKREAQSMLKYSEIRYVK